MNGMDQSHYTAATRTALNKIRQHGYAYVIARGQSYTRSRVEVNQQAIQPLLNDKLCTLELSTTGHLTAKAT